MNILEKMLALISVLLLILCMLAPLKRAEPAQKHPWIRHVTGFHAVYGVILLATGLAHGILAGSGPAMMTGKLGWMLLLILTVLTPLKKKQNRLSGAGYILHSEQQYVYLWSCILFRRSLCNVAFATCTYRLQPHRAARTSISLRSISVVAFATCTKKGKVFWNASIPQPFPLFCTRCSMLNVKNRRPRGSQCPQKQRFLSARSGVRTLDTLIKRHTQ